MEPSEMRRRVAEARVGRLATVRPDGAPHLVVCCFALDPDPSHGDTVWTVVDGKPKSTQQLQRLRNLEANPNASLLVDHYDDADWTRLWWVRCDGLATVSTDPVPDPLRDKYAQYGPSAHPPTGPLITLTIRRWTAWEADPGKTSKKL